MLRQMVSGVSRSKLATIALFASTLCACGTGGDIRLFPVEVPATPAPSDTPPTTSRDPLLKPFASTSFWNVPLGNQAALEPAELAPATLGIRTEAVVILLDTTAPALSVTYNPAGWTGADRCPVGTEQQFLAYAPSDFLVVEGRGKTSTPIVALQADGRTLEQGLPFARCEAGGAATIAFQEDPSDLYGDGRFGANGGSGLSALGGVLRLGELLPDGEPPRHALAIHLHGEQNLWQATNEDDCFRWPAARADSYCLESYGGRQPELKMGSLLALPPGALPALRTDAAQKLAWTLQNYGAYVVNDAGSASYAFNVELSPQGWFVEEFEAAWGFTFQTTELSSDWALDVQTLFDALQVVTDNSPSTPGGAGTPLQPLLPTLQPP
jgi:hypothetical protein